MGFLLDAFGCIYNYIYSMQALAAHLKRKNLKILEQELSLPKIPEKVPMHGPQTSARSRKQKQPLKYVSQTTLSPEQQHIQDQIRMVLHRQVKEPQEYPNTPDLKQKLQIKREKSLLPKIKNGNETAYRELQAYRIDDKQKSPAVGARKSRSQSSKFDLDSIFKNQSQFIENYFADISAKAKR